MNLQVNQKAAVAVLLSVLALTGCGGKGGSTAGSTPSEPTAGDPGTAGASAPPTVAVSGQPGKYGPPPSAFKALTECMRRQGINVPNDTKAWSPPPGTDVNKVKAALAACAKFMPQAH